jgi:hypothetical protein
MSNFVHGSGPTSPAIGFLVDIRDSESYADNELVVNLMKFIHDFQLVAPQFRDYDGTVTRLRCETLIYTNMSRDKAVKLLGNYGLDDCYINYDLRAWHNTRALVDIRVPYVPQIEIVPMDLALFVRDLIMDASVGKRMTGVLHPFILRVKNCPDTGEIIQAV